MALTEAIYRATDCLPRSEEYGLKSQLRRAAVSIPTNIAEGQARSTPRSFAAFLDIALGSLRELETLLELAIRLKRGNAIDLEKCCAEAGQVARELVPLLRTQHRADASQTLIARRQSSRSQHPTAHCDLRPET